MTDDKLVEALAKAMFEAEHAGLSNCYAWDDHWEEYQEVERPRYYTRARACLPIIREHTPKANSTALLQWIIEANEDEMGSLPVASPFARHLRAVNKRIDDALSATSDDAYEAAITDCIAAIRATIEKEPTQ